MPTETVIDKRACFDFEITFSNGGGVQGQGFRLDIEGDAISDEELGRRIVQDLRLLMVGSVKILNKTIVAERHKRAAKAEAAPVGEGAPRPRRRAIDLSHPIAGGNAGRSLEGVMFQAGRVDDTAVNTATALDTPHHRHPGMADVADLPIAAFADLDAVVVRLTGMATRAITAEALAATEVRARAVLLETGWAKRWGSAAYPEGHPYLTREGAACLASQGARLVGIDALDIDDTDDPECPAHTLLLGAGIPIVKNLASLEALPTEGFRFSAAPVLLRGMGILPVRAWALLDPAAP